jgi:hypothetical protein
MKHNARTSAQRKAGKGNQSESWEVNTVPEFRHLG